MAKTVISGYYGFDNAGDEALLSAITSTLKQIDPDLEITVLSGNPERTKQLHGVNAISRTHPGQIIRELRSADLLISGGGGLLQDVTGPFSVPYYLGVMALAKLVGTPVMLYAHGVGPVNRWTNKILVRLVANRADLITLRDDQSRDELVQLGVSQPEMLVTADPVLGFLAGGMAGYGRRLLAQFGLQKNGRPAAGIALRGWPGMERLKPAVAEFADDLVSQGWDVVYVPMHYPEDLKTCLDMMALMKNPATVIDRALTTQQALTLIGEFDLVIGMRLHALIFAAVMGVPFIGISYDPKVKQFLGMLGFEPAGEVGRVTGEELKAKLTELVSQRQQFAAVLQEKIPSLREMARSNAVMAIEMIRNINSSGNPVARSRVEILGTLVDRVGMNDAVDRVSRFIESGTPHHVITLNAEIIERAQNEPVLRDLINSADLVTPDGAGVVWASRYLGRPVPERVTGIDLLLELVKAAPRSGWRLFLLGAAPGVAEEAAARLQEQHPGLSIVGTHHGYFGEAENPSVGDKVRDAGADILFAALGAPKQEYWISSNLDNLGVSAAIGVGGSFDVIAGRVKRAPAWMRKLQLEWLGRLIMEPSRFRRMLALPRFVLRVMLRGRKSQSSPKFF